MTSESELLKFLRTLKKRWQLGENSSPMPTCSHLIYEDCMKIPPPRSKHYIDMSYKKMVHHHFPLLHYAQKKHLNKFGICFFRKIRRTIGTSNMRNKRSNQHVLLKDPSNVRRIVNWLKFQEISYLKKFIRN